VTWVIWNLILVHLETVLVLLQARCTVCTKRSIGSEIVLDAPDGTLGDVGHVESHRCPFGDSVSVGARYVHGLRRTYHSLRNSFGCTRWYSYVTRLKWMLVSVRLEIVQILMQYRSTVCAEQTTCTKIILDTPNRTLR
jgi:hypothetical protein